MKIQADKIASSTKNAKLQRELTLSTEIICKEGYIIAVRALEEKNTYNTLELVSGRMSKICQGDIIAGVLGARNALKGFSGKINMNLSLWTVLHRLG